jgi:hypothetical protein
MLLMSSAGACTSAVMLQQHCSSYDYNLQLTMLQYYCCSTVPVVTVPAFLVLDPSSTTTVLGVPVFVLQVLLLYY